MDINDYLTSSNTPVNPDDRQSRDPPLIQMNTDDVTVDDVTADSNTYDVGTTNGCAFDQNVNNYVPHTNNYQVFFIFSVE